MVDVTISVTGNFAAAKPYPFNGLQIGLEEFKSELKSVEYGEDGESATLVFGIPPGLSNRVTDYIADWLLANYFEIVVML